MASKENYPKSEIRRLAALIEKKYNKYADDIAGYAKNYKISYKKPFWKNNKNLKKYVDKSLGGLKDEVAAEIVKGVDRSWLKSNLLYDELIATYTKGFSVPVNLVKAWSSHNQPALNAFLGRSVNGLRLSGRVWQHSLKARKMIEYTLASGIIEGQSAASISRIIRQSLKNPNSLFRRVKNPETGELELSKPAKNFNPGTGVYRSAYQNSLRLASTEINMAYRTAEFTRINQVPFIVGFEVKLSAAHPVLDICDSMTGRYPKTFHFFGWHPKCICFAVPITLSKKKFAEYLKTGRISSKEYIKSIPSQATNYVKAKSETYAKASNPPYFIQVNFKKIKGVYKVSK